uniref:Prolyl-tRNA synthetase n=1 Tax=Arundo donax TaxID=35708 RepID=A0A0A9FXT0_ARUDO
MFHDWQPDRGSCNFREIILGHHCVYLLLVIKASFFFLFIFLGF